MDYFSTDERRADLKRILDEWLGTPFRHMCGVKGRGADCIRFVAAVFTETGAIPKPKIRPYPKDWHLHNDTELMFETIMGHGRFREVQAGVMDGDILLYRFGRVASHSGIYCSGAVYHSVTGIGVVRTAFSEGVWAGRVQHILRLAK